MAAPPPSILLLTASQIIKYKSWQWILFECEDATLVAAQNQEKFLEKNIRELVRIISWDGYYQRASRRCRCESDGPLI